MEKGGKRMTKLENVINGLECWVKSATAAQECDGDCPYRTTVEEQQVMGECNWPNLFKDALELLKDMNEKLVRTTTLFRQANARNCALLDKLAEQERQGQEW